MPPTRRCSGLPERLSTVGILPAIACGFASFARREAGMLGFPWRGLLMRTIAGLGSVAQPIAPSRRPIELGGVLPGFGVPVVPDLSNSVMAWERSKPSSTAKTRLGWKSAGKRPAFVVRAKRGWGGVNFFRGCGGPFFIRGRGSGGIRRTSMGLRRLRLTRFRVHAIVPGRISHDEIEGVRRQVAEGPHVGEEPHPATQKFGRIAPLEQIPLICVFGKPAQRRTR